MRALILTMLVSLTLTACATTARLGAAADVHALLIAIRDNDRDAFDARVDRDALTDQLADRMAGELGGDGPGRGLPAVAARPLARLAVQALMRPEVFRAVAEYYGYRPGTPVPSQITIAAALKALPDGRVCATRTKNGPCLMTFARGDAGWRLVSFDGDPRMLRRNAP